MAVLFVSGLLFVSVIKNETRNLQKEINKLEASINVIQFNLHQAILDNEVITSPKNISRLAKEHLNTELVAYKRSQIKKLGNEDSELSKNSIKKEKKIKKNIKNLSSSATTKIAEKIKNKKMELANLKKIYKNPKTMPTEVNNMLAKQIKYKKKELKNIYESPKDLITLERVGKWTVVQVVKAFLGMPIITGR